MPERIDGINKIEPHWHHKWANRPSIHIHLDAEPKGFKYQVIPEGASERCLLLSTNVWPWVRFVFIADPTGTPEQHGALGGEYPLVDGTVFKTNTGWSGGAYAINRNYERFVEDDVVDVTLHWPGWNIGFAGFTIYQSHLRAHPLWPEGCHLVRQGTSYHISVDPREILKPELDTTRRK